MAVLKIHRMGSPVLQKSAERVDDLAAPDISQLIADMKETLDDVGGIGLAAPQVGVSKRVVIYYKPGPERDEEEGEESGEDGDGGDENEEDARNRPLVVLINPVIEPVGEAAQQGWESCLSLPDVTGLVPRYRDIRYMAWDQDAKPVQAEASGFHARVVQHECDHLDGILYPMRMPNMAYFGYVDEMRAQRAEDGGGGAEEQEL